MSCFLPVAFTASRNSELSQAFTSPLRLTRGAFGYISRISRGRGPLGPTRCNWQMRLHRHEQMAYQSRHWWSSRQASRRCYRAQRTQGWASFSSGIENCERKYNLHIVLVFGREVVPCNLEQTNLVVDDQERGLGLVESFPGVCYIAKFRQKPDDS
jgi:hypothetical protein